MEKKYKGFYQSGTKKENSACNFCMNCLNAFWTESARDKLYEYRNSNGQVKVKMPSEKEK